MNAANPTSEHTVETRETTAAERFAANSADVLNAVTWQKNDLSAQIENSEDLRDLKAAEKSFRLVRDLWHAVGYGYKVAEMRDRLIGKARRLAADCRELARMTPARQYATRNRLAGEATHLEAYANDL
jgi:hypothetical protein